LKGRKVIEVWPHTSIQALAERTTNQDAQYLLAGLFGTGARLNEFLSLRKKDITTSDDGIVRVILPTFKNPNTHARTIHLHPKHEAWIIKPIIERADRLQGPEELLLQKSGRWVQKKCKFWFHKHPHFFRHCRATYNYNFWNMRDVEVQKFMGWSDTQMAATYTHLTENDMLAIFKRFDNHAT
jgi:integrase